MLDLRSNFLTHIGKPHLQTSTASLREVLTLRQHTTVVLVETSVDTSQIWSTAVEKGVDACCVNGASTSILRTAAPARTTLGARVGPATCEQARVPAVFTVVFSVSDRLEHVMFDTRLAHLLAGASSRVRAYWL